MGSVELLLLAGADLSPASRTERKHGHCQRSRAGSQRGTRPESIKALRDKSPSLQPTGLQELHNCHRSKRSQVLQDTLPSDAGYYSAGLRVGLSLCSAREMHAPAGSPRSLHQGTGYGAGKKGFCGFQLNRFLEGKWNAGNSNHLGIHALQTAEYNALPVIERPHQTFSPTSPLPYLPYSG